MSSEQISKAVQSYVDYVGTGTADQVMSLYATTATVEDPIGSELKATPEAIREFYANLEFMEQTATLKWVRIAGDTAVFEFTLVTKVGDVSYEVTPIDIMRFDDEGKVTSMRAVWDPATDLKQV